MTSGRTVTRTERMRLRCAAGVTAAVAGGAACLCGPLPSAGAVSSIDAAPPPDGRGAAASSTGLSPCAIPALHLRCPNLVMSAPSQLHFDRTTIPGRVLLRATSSINNRGRGPLELRAHRLPSGAWAVYQVVYDWRKRAHVFRTLAQLVYKFVPGERYGYGNVGSQSFWKLREAAAFQLWSLDSQFHSVRLVRAGPKVDYCLRDLFRTRPSATSPVQAVYPACQESQAIARDVLGTSVGWSDVYPYGYPAQWIDVTGLRGRFAYVQTADPSGLLIESTYRDNVSEVFVSLPSGRILGPRVSVSGP